jgi:cobalt-zinc-cadmium efflux system protein
MGSGHAHGRIATDAGRHRTRLFAVFAITVAALVAEVVGGIVSGSLALLADAAHLATDAAGLALALIAITLAQRPATPQRTWGLARAEVLAAAVNAAALGIVGIWVLVEAVQRLADPPQLESGVMLAFGLVGLVGNVVGLGLLAGVQRESMNLRGAYLEVATDALASAGVILAALLYRYADVTRADAVVALAIAVFILPRAFRLLRDAVDVLLEATPKHIDLAEVRAHILAVPHVLDVHDVHASTVTSGLPVLTAHVVVESDCFHDGHAPQLLDQLQACLAADFDVEHSTFQLEPAGHSDHEQATHA